MSDDSTLRISVRADSSQADKVLSDLEKKIQTLEKSIASHEKNDQLLRRISAGGGIALAASSVLNPLVEFGFGEKVAKTMQTTVSSAVALSAALTPLGPIGAATGLALGGVAGAMSSLYANSRKARESAERAAEAIKRAAEAEDRRALSVAVDRRLTYQDVSDMWWTDPESARRMLEQKRAPLRRLQAVAAEGAAAPLEEIQAIAPYLRREELTELLSSMKGQRGWTDSHADYFDVFEFAQTAKLAATPVNKRGALGEPIPQVRGQERALYDVSTRWQTEEPLLAQRFAIIDSAIRNREIYSKAAEYAIEYAEKADAAHGQLPNLDLFLSPAPTQANQELPQQAAPKTGVPDILSRLLPSTPQADALGSVGKGVAGQSVTEELVAGVKKLVDIAERQLSETRWSRGGAVLA